VGDVPTAYTTHTKSGSIRRNGGQIGDQATITTHVLRHGDMLTVASLLDAPFTYPSRAISRARS